MKKWEKSMSIRVASGSLPPVALSNGSMFGSSPKMKKMITPTATTQMNTG